MGHPGAEHRVQHTESASTCYILRLVRIQMMWCAWSTLYAVQHNEHLSAILTSSVTNLLAVLKYFVHLKIF